MRNLHNQNGAGTDSRVTAATQRAIALKATHNIRVINLSLGRPVSVRYSLDPLCLAVESAWRSGIVVVVSAGNEGRNNSMRTSGYASITAPGNDPYVITVGAMKTIGTPGKGDDLIAPGNRIGSALAANGTLSEKSTIASVYYSMSGTKPPHRDFVHGCGAVKSQVLLTAAYFLITFFGPSALWQSRQAVEVNTRRCLAEELP